VFEWKARMVLPRTPVTSNRRSGKRNGTRTTASRLGGHHLHFVDEYETRSRTE
jgi:hypothetical protein